MRHGGARALLDHDTDDDDEDVMEAVPATTASNPVEAIPIAAAELITEDEEWGDVLETEESERESDTDDELGLADGIARLMDDPVLRESLDKAGRAGVQESFTADIMARETWTVYEQLCSAHSSSGTS